MAVGERRLRLRRERLTRPDRRDGGRLLPHERGTGGVQAATPYFLPGCSTDEPQRQGVEERADGASFEGRGRNLMAAPLLFEQFGHIATPTITLNRTICLQGAPRSP